LSVALSVRVSLRAAGQIRAAAQWWAENRPSAPGAVRVDLSQALALISQQPGIGAPCEGIRLQGVRRLLVSRIRYFIYYRATADAVEVLAVWHVSRGKQPSL
jgi:plasmid stabilization system protein ParE